MNDLDKVRTAYHDGYTNGMRYAATRAYRFRNTVLSATCAGLTVALVGVCALVSHPHMPESQPERVLAPEPRFQLNPRLDFHDGSTWVVANSTTPGPVDLRKPEALAGVRMRQWRIYSANETATTFTLPANTLKPGGLVTVTY